MVQYIIEKDEILSNNTNNEDYLKLYKFCEEVENRRELKISNIATLKGSFNETNENYLNNNLFYNSIANLVNSSSDSDYEECKQILEKAKSKQKSNNINEEKKEDKNKDKKNTLKNGKNKDINNSKNGIFDGVSYMGDFNENNLKGGLIVLSTSYEDEEQYNNMDNNNMGNNNINYENNKREDEKQI